MESLTVEEEKILKRIESSGRRDHLFYGLSLLLPCFVVVGIGLWLSKLEIIVAGALGYALLYLWILVHQDRLNVLLRSALKKLRDQSSQTSKS